VQRRLRDLDRSLIVVVAIAAVGSMVAWQLVAGHVSGATPTTPGPPPAFIDETASSGLTFTYDGPFDAAVGGGVAVFDCDEDGRPDLYIAGGAGPAALFHNDSPVGGSLRFSRRPDPVTDLTNVNGAYPINLDGDAHTDLIVLRNGGNVALRGLGNCRFELANEALQLDGGSARTQAFSAMWEPGASLPTLAFGNYVDPTINDPARWCEANQLIRPVPAQAVFGRPEPLTPSYCSLSMLFSDWDGSGRMDLRVSNDEHYYGSSDGGEQLWRMEPGMPPRLYTAADGWVLVRIQGMGIASYDLTGDGLPEVYLTSQSSNRLQTLAAGASQPSYRDIGVKRGADAAQPYAGDTQRPSTAWHPEFADVNNDGFIDLFVSKGNVQNQADYAQKDPSDLLLGQADGTFQEVAQQAGIMTFDRGRGAALADFNLDGRLDLVESFYGAPVRVWRNGGPVASAGGATNGGNAHWLALRVHQAGPNVDAIGAVVEVQVGDLTYRRELTIGGGHAGGQLTWIHFGLGPSNAARVRVTWPGGEAGPWMSATADTFGVIERGGSAIALWHPGG
jgi:enediyne biosynthesis protein E4